MKKLFFLIWILIPVALFAQPWMNTLPQDKIEKGDLTFYEIQKAFNDYWEPFNVKDGYYYVNGEKIKAGGWKQFKRWEWYWETRVDPKTGAFPRTTAWEEFQKYLKKYPGAKSPSGNWTSLGPSSTSGGYAGLGRLNCVAFRPGDNNTIYVGAPAGGIWKSTNGGSSWTPIGDNNASIGVSDIVVVAGATPASDIIYIATGDRDHFDTKSVGVLKSTDGGTTWSTTGLSFTASQGKRVSRLLMDPANTNILYAATSDGVFKTTNAGANWSNIYGISFIDMEFKPESSSYIYGSNTYGDIYRSTNAGSSWSQVLSTSLNRTQIAVSLNNPGIVYAVMGNSSSGLGAIYKSTDSGSSFSLVYSPGLNILGWNCDGSGSGGQAWYDLCIASDPNNANIVFVGGVNTWKSSNGGASWNISNHWSSTCGGSATNVHADKHFLAYQNGTSTLFECNDGGLYKTSNAGSNWTHLGSGLVVSQIYRIGVAQTVATDVVCGLQDNGTKNISGSTWDDVLGGDGMDCAVDYTNANTQYGEYYNGAMRRTTNHWFSTTDITGGLSGSAAWVTPYVIDPGNHNTLYVGYQDIFKSTNQGSSWTKISNWNGNTLRSVAVAPSNSNYIYTATSYTLYRTTNGGTSWTDITGSLPTGSASITWISVKDNDPNTIWVSMGQFNSYGVYQSTNGGASWTNISPGLPAIPVNCVVQNKLNNSQIELYAATDAGVYYKSGSANWQLFSTGLPNVVVDEIEIYYNPSVPANSKLRAGTFGRGLWESDLYTAAAAPVADFSASPTTVGVNQTVIFTDLSTNTPTYWHWSFSGPGNAVFVDGTNANSTNPHVQFDAMGSYTVSLYVSNSLGNDTETKTDYINVSVNYCTPTYSTGTGYGDYISLVQLGDINNSTGALSSPYYFYYDNLVTDLAVGTAYSITLSAGTYSSGNNISVWIDFNHDGSFDPSEKLGNVTLGATPETGTIDFTVPSNSAEGITRMRVREVWNNTTFNPCNNYEYGEAEDYNINIIRDLDLDVKVFLEGPYNGTDMNTAVNSILPLAQPFSGSPWNYSGSESVSSIPGSDIVDWVLVDIRDASNAALATPATSIGMQAAFLRNDGKIVGLNGDPVISFSNTSVANNLFVVIFPRNHVPVISGNAVIKTGGVYTYDFSTAAGQALGGANGHKDLGGGVWGMFSGNSNGDYNVNDADKDTNWKSEAGMSGYLSSDVNMDGESNNVDKNDMWVPNNGKSSQVPQ